MPDGSVPVVMSMVERALQLPGWRALRRKLTGPLRRKLPINPPADMVERKVLALRVLRERRRLMAEEALPRWHVPYTMIARIVGRDRGTVADWAAVAPGVIVERGGVVIDGVTALEAARERGAEVTTMEAAIAWLDERHQTLRVDLPDEGAGEPDRRYEPFPKLGTGDPTIDELAALAFDAGPYDSPKKKIERVRRVRAALTRYGLQVAEGERVPRRWLMSPAGDAFMFATPMGRKAMRRFLAAEKKFSRKRARR